jgi:hypothetical protein
MSAKSTHLLNGTYALEHLRTWEKKRRAEADCLSLWAQALGRGRSSFVKYNESSSKRFEWALKVAHGRAFPVHHQPSSDTFLILAPVADILPHTTQTPTKDPDDPDKTFGDNAARAFVTRSNSILCTAVGPGGLQEGQELRLIRGSFTDAEALAKFGPSGIGGGANAHNSVSLSIEDPSPETCEGDTHAERLSLANARLVLVRECGSEDAFTVGTDGPSVQLMCGARATLANKTEIEAVKSGTLVNFSRPVSADNEVKAAALLHATLEEILKKYPTSDTEVSQRISACQLSF